MGNAIESALTGSAPGARQGFKDGLGERIIVPGAGPGEMVEVLQLRSDLTAVSSFEFALRERAARLANFQHESYARVRHIDRSAPPDGRLAIVSEHVDGWRLADILAAAAERHLEFDVNAALSLVGQLVHAVAILHRHARGVAHGAIAPERIVVTAHARLVIVEYVLGSALERLELTRERLWRELRVAAPPAAGGLRFDHRADVTQVGAVALALVLGRPLGDDDFPHHVADLLGSATEDRALGGRQPLSKPLRAWLARALQLDFRNSFPSAIEAEAALDALLTEEPAYVAAPVALETFLAQYERTLRSTKPVDEVENTAETTRPHVAPSGVAASVNAKAGGPSGVVVPAPPAAADQALDASDRTNAASEPFAIEPLDLPPATQPETPRVDPEPEASLAVGRSLKTAVPTRHASILQPVDPTEEATILDAIDPPAPESRGTSVLTAPAGADRPPASAEDTEATPAADKRDREHDLGQGYPGAFETMFGTRPDGRTVSPAPAETGIDGTGHRARPRMLRLALAAAAVIVLAAGGYIVFRLFLAGATPPPTGTLTVESDPAGLAVKIDGKPRGATPLKAALAPGRHVLTIDTPNQARVVPITITAGGQVSQYIETQSAPVTGRLQITSEPPGAAVFIDGEARGTAPLTIGDLAAGLHRVELQGTGGKVQQDVTIEAGGTSSLVVPVAQQSGPVSGWIGVTAPVEVQVFEGEQLLGTSRSARILMTAGRHELELVNETLGYRSPQVVLVTPGKLLPIRVALPKGTLNVNAVPWAEVWIDGARIGETPLGNLALPIGPHEIVFRHPQYAEQRHAVTVTMKAPVRVSVDLRK